MIHDDSAMIRGIPYLNFVSVSFPMGGGWGLDVWDARNGLKILNLGGGSSN